VTSWYGMCCEGGSATNLWRLDWRREGRGHFRSQWQHQWRWENGTCRIALYNLSGWAGLDWAGLGWATLFLIVVGLGVNVDYSASLHCNGGSFELRSNCANGG
jgi:hypothetical protein